MKFLITIIFAFILSLPLIAKETNPIITGSFCSNTTDSILSKNNPDLYNLLLNRLQQDFLLNFLDTLDSCGSYVNDTISGCDWSTIPWNDSLVYLSIPDFPNCTLLVAYKVRICPNNPLIRQIHLVTFAIDYSYYTECEDFSNYLHSGTEEEKAIKLQEIKDKLYLSISQHESEQMGDFPPCDSLGNYLPQYVFYKEAACKTEILFKIEYHSVMYFIYEDIVCNKEAGCCKTTISFCQDGLGNPQQQITKEIINSDCYGLPSPIDYQRLLDQYIADHPYAVSVTFELFPCINACE